MQTLRAGCGKAEPQIFTPPQTSFQRRGTSKILSAEEGRWSLYVYLKTQFGEDRYTQFRVIVVTDPQQITTENDIIDYNSLGTFYKFVNKRLSYRNVIGTLVDDDGNFITSDDEKSNLFNNYFGSFGVVDNIASPICNSVLRHDSSLETVEFTAHNVGLAMKKLKSSLSCGPDGLPPLLFKHLRYCLAEPLALMYTQLLSVSAVPPEWKQAVVTSVFKKGTAGDVSNYRPISLTCVPSKIMEHV